MKPTKIKKVYYQCTHCQNMVEVNIPEEVNYLEHDMDDDRELIEHLYLECLDVHHCDVCGSDETMVLIDAGVAELCKILSKKGYYTIEGHEAALVHTPVGLHATDFDYANMMIFPSIIFSWEVSPDSLEGLPDEWECCRVFEIDDKKYYQIKYVPDDGAGNSEESKAELMESIIPEAMNKLTDWAISLPENNYLFAESGGKIVGFGLCEEDKWGHNSIECEIDGCRYAFAFYDNYNSYAKLSTSIQMVYRVAYSDENATFTIGDYEFMKDSNKVRCLSKLLSEWFKMMARNLDEDIKSN